LAGGKRPPDQSSCCHGWWACSCGRLPLHNMHQLRFAPTVPASLEGVASIHCLLLCTAPVSCEHSPARDMHTPRTPW
jgi:hypothetical protein